MGGAGRQALLCSLVLRSADRLPGRGGLAVADRGTSAAREVAQRRLVDGGKVAGVLAEARPQEGWAALGIGVNVAVAPAAFPAEVREGAATLGRTPAALEGTLAELLASPRRLAEQAEAASTRCAPATPCSTRPCGGTAAPGRGRGSPRRAPRSAAGRRVELAGAGEVHLLSLEVKAGRGLAPL